ncbi:MAG: hypothetical protein E7561_02315 [Ruminococcaceae bacterium]|nr:hypothetical protein [Oscillospiraceae bacterium]
MESKESFVGADVALKEKSEVAVLTAGISMRPMLREHRDVVIIERVTRPLRANDVPLYRRPNESRLVLHRILKVRRDGGYVIRGDNLLFKEYDVKDEDIVGVLKAFYRDGKYYDCAKSIPYKLYIVYNRATFVFRLLRRKYLPKIIKRLPLLRKMKRAIVGFFKKK